MKVLVTGAKGFIAKHLIKELNRLKDIEVYLFDKDTSEEYFEMYCSDCDFVFHLAGVDKALHESEYMDSNVTLANKLLSNLKKHQNTCPIIFTSSIYALQQTPYGISKKAAEDLLLTHKKETGAKVYIYRLPDVFGDGSKPNHNSIIADLCYNIARGRNVFIDNPKSILKLTYIKDLIEDFILLLTDESSQDSNTFCSIKEMSLALGEVVDLFHIFRKCQEYKVSIPLPDPFLKNLYDTYLSFLQKSKIEDFK